MICNYLRSQVPSLMEALAILITFCNFAAQAFKDYIANTRSLAKHLCSLSSLFHIFQNSSSWKEKESQDVSIYKCCSANSEGFCIFLKPIEQAEWQKQLRRGVLLYQFHPNRAPTSMAWAVRYLETSLVLSNRRE